MSARGEDAPAAPVTITTEDHERVRVVRLTRPERRNAVDPAMARALVAALDAAEADDHVGVVVLTGDDPAFCAGVDLGAIGDAPEEFGAITRAAATRVRTMRKPVIGAINGACVTGGLEIALSCDVLVASERARFADTHLQMGVLPSWGGSALLPQAVGVRRAKELALSGRFVGAEEAARIGLVNAVVAHDELLDHARELAETVAQVPSAVATAWLELCDAGDGDPLERRVARERAVAAPIEAEARRVLAARMPAAAAERTTTTGGA